MTLLKLAGISAPAITAATGFASAQQQLQFPPGRIYAFHSGAQSGCPPMDWHIVVQEGGALAGMISWNNMQSIARVSGAADQQTGKFQMTATEGGGRGRTATVDGTVNTQDGWLIAEIAGPNLKCHGCEGSLVRALSRLTSTSLVFGPQRPPAVHSSEGIPLFGLVLCPAVYEEPLDRLKHHNSLVQLVHF